jgi:AcrR family transcriptional regulator
VIKPKSKSRRPAGAGAGAPAERDGDTEQRILDAAHRVFLHRGTAGARMQEIADEADVNKALLHYYFRSKARLAEAVFRHAAQQLLPPVIAILASDLELADKVERVVDLELRHLARSPYLPGYLLSELNHHPERAHLVVTAIAGLPPEKVRATVLDALRRQIDARVRTGAMRAIAPEQFVVNLLSLCVFPFAARPMLTIILGLDDKGFQRFIERRRNELVPFFLGALRP